MTLRTYRLAVLLCAASWFMFGLHAREVHHLGDPDRPVMVLLFTAAFAIVGATALVALLRARTGDAR